MPKYKVTDRSYGNYNGRLNYSYAFDTTKFNGLEDLKKAKTYLTWLIEEEAKNGQNEC